MHTNTQTTHTHTHAHTPPPHRCPRSRLERRGTVTDEQLPPAHSEATPFGQSTHPEESVTAKPSGIRKLRLWVKGDGHVIPVPSLREAATHTVRSACRNSLCHFQEIGPLSDGHCVKCQEGRPRTNGGQLPGEGLSPDIPGRAGREFARKLLHVSPTQKHNRYNTDVCDK